MGVAVETVARRPSQQPDDNETYDVSIRKLRLVGALKKGGINVDITQVITDGHVEDSTTGAPQLTVDLVDRDYGALQSGVFGQTVDVELDGIPWRLVEVSLTDVETLELLFEHKLVNLLRQHKSPIKAARSSVTRAQFIEIMLKEIAGGFPVRYISPEVNKIQPITASKTSGRSLTSKTIGSTVAKSVKGSGFGVTNLNIRSWDGSTVTLGPTQLKNASIVLQVCKQLGASAKATLAVMAACVVEPAKPFENTPPGPQGAGILSWTGGKSWANDVAQAVTHALQDPGATGRGGMMSLASKNPGWTAGQIAQSEQGSAFPARYDQAAAGAQAVIGAFTSAGGYAATGVNFGSTGASTYEFSRGQPGQAEDSWTCMQRLAKEVNWRLFVSGRNSLYFVTDDDLMAAPPIYNLNPRSKGTPRLTFQAEVGGRTIRRHRHRQPKPSEAQLVARIDRWAAPPGSVISLDEFGPGDGRWLVVDTVRPLFDKEATVHLQSPQAPFKEPAASSGTSATGTIVGPQASGSLTSANPIDRVYAASIQIDRRNLPYVYGGGHTGNWQTAAQASGLDCSGAVSLALYAAGLMPGQPGPITSGSFATWGQPGRGAQMTVWYNAGHVFIEFYGRPAKRFDTVPGGSGGDGPHMRYTAPGSAGDTWEAHGFFPRHVSGY
jgi:hypothetical protein